MKFEIGRNSESDVLATVSAVDVEEAIIKICDSEIKLWGRCWLREPGGSLRWEIDTDRAASESVSG